MAPSRISTAKKIAKLVGVETLLLDEEPGDGWPATGVLKQGDQSIRVRLYVSLVGLSHRKRDHLERRFQNPHDSPRRVIHWDSDGPLQLLLGLWEEPGLDGYCRPVVVSADPKRRHGHDTRFSVFVGLQALLSASMSGWGSYRSSSGEFINCFHPALFEAASMLDHDELAWPDDFAAGLFSRTRLRDAEAPLDRKRARSLVDRLVRRAGFRKEVVQFYGEQCAMCGVGEPLLQGAHVLPVSAPGSSDSAKNGLALCCNHHQAFDRHLVYIDPGDFSIRLKNETDWGPGDCGKPVLQGCTRRVLRRPKGLDRDALVAALRSRYQYFPDECYDWAMTEPDAQ